MPSYTYSNLAPGKHSIRLLRLLPDENDSAPIKCVLFNYVLTGTRRGCHLYEALSYVWGVNNGRRSIIIDDREHPVTDNLYAALLRLRDPHLDRVLWIDALCVHQDDLDERGQQVQLMARIYGMASRVIVWLGETEESGGQALEAIATVARSGSIESVDDPAHYAISRLLRRPWFSRIWVLQEVAAARQILITCGAVEVEGYAFCQGLNALELDNDLRTLVESVTYLMKGAIAMSRIKARPSGQDTLDISSLGELMDMYHTRDATERHDKIFALLSMSSDDPIQAGIVPNYRDPWERLFQQVIGFMLHRDLVVRTWPGVEAAVIQGKGYVFGRVSSIKSNAGGSGQQITVGLGDTDDFLYYPRDWTVRASAKSVQVDDLVCMLDGATNPMVIRPHRDYFSVIRVSLPVKVKLPLHTGTQDLLLIWSWNEHPSTDSETEEYANMIELLAPEHAAKEIGNHSDKATRFWNAGMSLQPIDEYMAETSLREALVAYTKGLGEGHPHTIRCIHVLLLLRKRNHHVLGVEDLLEMLVRIKVRAQGSTPDTLESIMNLVSTYRKHGDHDEAGRWELFSNILTMLIPRGVEIPEQTVLEIMQSPSMTLILLLFERGGSLIRLSDHMVETIVSNERWAYKIFEFLLKHRADDVRVTENVVNNAIRNGIWRWHMLELLSDRGGFHVTDKTLKLAEDIGRYRDQVLSVLRRIQDEESSSV